MNEFMDEKEKDDYISWISVIRRNRTAKIRTRPVAKSKVPSKRQSHLERNKKDVDS